MAHVRHYAHVSARSLRGDVRDQSVDGSRRPVRTATWHSGSGSGSRPCTRSSATRSSVIEPIEGLPDMVFAANGGRSWTARCYGAQFANAERAAGGPGLPGLVRRRGFPRCTEPEHVNEGEGDFLVARRRDPRRHRLPHRPRGARRGAGVLRPPGDHAAAGGPALLPPGHGAVRARRPTTSPTTRRRSPRAAGRCCERLFPDAVHRDRRGRRGARPQRGLRRPPRGAATPRRPGSRCSSSAAATTPIPVDLSELRKAGGGPKCCTLEIRSMTTDEPTSADRIERRPSAARAHNYHPLPGGDRARPRAPG